MQRPIPCMSDNRGRVVKQWLPHMQSEEFLRDAIAHNDRAQECWVELTTRNKRWHAAQRVINKRPA